MECLNGARFRTANHSSANPVAAMPQNSITIAELRLATGSAVELLAPLSSDDGVQLFAAKAIDTPDGEPTRTVIVHPAAPEGPTAGALLDRMASIRAAGHPGLAAPLATGEVNGQGWIVEPNPPVDTLARRLTRGGMPTSEIVGLLRDVTRALLALHRRGVAHGALTPACLTRGGDGAVVLHQLGRTASTDANADWRSLGVLTQEIVRQSRAGRDQLPEGIVSLLDRMVASGAAGPGLTGNDILGVLDRFPASGSTSELALVDRVGLGSRDHAERRTLILAALAGVAVVLWFLLRTP